MAYKLSRRIIVPNPCSKQLKMDRKFLHCANLRGIDWPAHKITYKVVMNKGQISALKFCGILSWRAASL